MIIDLCSLLKYPKLLVQSTNQVLQVFLFLLRYQKFSQFIIISLINWHFVVVLLDTYVMTVTATDADEGIFAEIAYSIVEQSPPQGGNMFFIKTETGQIYVQRDTLDREVIIWLSVYWEAFNHTVKVGILIVWQIV